MTFTGRKILYAVEQIRMTMGTYFRVTKLACFT